MKAVSGKSFAKLLEMKGWQLARVKGSHHIYTKKGNLARITVPIHGSSSLKIGLQCHLMKVAGIKEYEI